MLSKVLFGQTGQSFTGQNTESTLPKSVTSTVGQKALKELPSPESLPAPLTAEKVTPQQQTPTSITIEKASFFLNNRLKVDAEFRNDIVFFLPLHETQMCTYTGYGTFVKENGDKYTGDWVEGKLNGFGIVTFKEGPKCEGYWLNGEMNGYGVLLYKDGSRFEGNFEKHELHGFAYFIDREGSTYEGNWFYGVQSGFGVAVSKEKSKYTGMWENGTQHGFGILEDPKLGSSEGLWANGKQNGYGVSILINGSRFEGYTVDAEPCGYGRFQFKEGEIYEGYLKQGKQWGYGIQIEPNKSRYEGYWANGEGHGFGIYQNNGLSLEGNWRRGKAHGQIVVKYNDSIIYEGEFRDGLPMALSTIQTSRYLKAVPKKAKKNMGVEVIPLKGIDADSWKEICNDALKNTETAFEANKRKPGFIGKIETLLTKEQLEKKKQQQEEDRKAGLRALLAQNQKGKSVSKPPSKQASSSSSSSSSTQNTAPVATGIEGPKLVSKSKYHSHKHVNRWIGATNEQIREFVDYVDGVPLKKYAHMGDAEINLWKMRHLLNDVERLITNENRGYYYTETERGFCMMAKLIRCGSEYYTECGDVYVAVNESTNVMFHKMFTPWAKPDEYERLFKAPEGLPDPDQSPYDAPWETVGDCPREIRSDGSIEFDYGTHKLLIYRLQ